MGQQPSSHGDRKLEDDNVPYTKYSHPTSIGSSDPGPKLTSFPLPKGITVVNRGNMGPKKPVEMVKLEKIHRFWPILRSSIDMIPPQERIDNGLDYKELSKMCSRYQLHLSETSNIVGMEQKALASRLKDLEMFSAGIAHQMLRRQERMHRAMVQLEKVNEVSTILDNIQSTLSHCVPLVQRLNNLLPEDKKLETFVLNPEDVQSDEERDTPERTLGGGEGGDEDAQDTLEPEIEYSQEQSIRTPVS